MGIQKGKKKKERNIGWQISEIIKEKNVILGNTNRALDGKSQLGVNHDE